MGVEFELKFAATEEILNCLENAFPGGETLKMSTTYYDTPDCGLSQQKYTLRTRLENGICVCTVKTPLAGNQRGEWEIVCNDILEAVGQLCALGAPKDLIALTKNGVIPTCGAKFTRQAVLIEKEDFSAELAMDRGVLTGGSKESPLCEVELEYKSGDMDAFCAYANSFAATYHLTPEPLSKFRRALNLYLGEK